MCILYMFIYVCLHNTHGRVRFGFESLHLSPMSRTRVAAPVCACVCLLSICDQPIEANECWKICAIHRAAAAAEASNAAQMNQIFY